MQIFEVFFVDDDFVDILTLLVFSQTFRLFVDDYAADVQPLPVVPQRHAPVAAVPAEAAGTGPVSLPAQSLRRHAGPGADLGERLGRQGACQQS